jgi:putative methionine-R-sulfoxide reductase with GAF domain
VSDKRDKPVLDEQALERLLEAAYVLQEHNREQQKLDLHLERQSNHLREQEEANPPLTHAADSASADERPVDNDYTVTLAQIVETQRQIQVRHLELESAMALVAERVTAITRASGAALGILDGKKVRYRAASGSFTLPLGTETSMDKAICLACLRVGQVIRCPDVNTEFLFDAEACRRRGIQSLIAVPIYHDGEIAGALELYFARSQAFSEQDVHSCQLMAGLVTEAFARDDEVMWKKSVAAERATMLEALEKLKPNLAALAGKSATKDSNSKHGGAGTAVSMRRSVCGNCGHELMSSEQFCGQCGSPRSKDGNASGIPGNIAFPVLQNHPSQNGGAASAPANGAGARASSERPANAVQIPVEDDMLASLQAELAADGIGTVTESPSQLEPVTADEESSTPLSSDPEEENPETAAPETALVKSGGAITWSSAANARDFLEELAAVRGEGAFARFWNARRGDIYLGVAVILVAVVIRWGIWSSHSVSATGGPAVTAGHRRPAPDADLSMFDRLLISLGLAEPPETPEYRGNPQTQVWVDERTALYYCPGTDLYGKTPKGKFTTQRDAQLDQFEPASRKACD